MGTTRQLCTLCTLAACALETLSSRLKSGWDDDPARPESLTSTRPAHIGGIVTGDCRSSISIHDAAFLNAVLPFALSQAQRHREPLSLLCVAIDRLGGFRELLGRTIVDRLVRHTGESIVSLVRASDIVARLDDDRVMVVLPRAAGEGAFHVARKIRRGVSEHSGRDSDLPGVTVSIGVATFPDCADNVQALFDAADDALSQAQSQGRNRSIIASAHPL